MKKILFVLLLIPTTSIGQSEDAFSLEASGVDNLEEGRDIEDDGDLQDSELDAILGGIDEEEDATASPETRRTREENIPQAPSDLGTLIPYEDIAVIQRRYLPKSGRFEVGPNLGIVLNNAFYLLSSYGLTMGYNFTEHWGVEASVGYVHNSLKKVTEDLASKRVSVDSITYPAYFYDVSVKYSPAYGKLGFFKSKILPFDMYFSLGFGQNFLDQILNVEEDLTVRNQKIAGINPINLKLGGGMVFALGKNMAFKWDASWRFYPVDTQEVYNRCPDVAARSVPTTPGTTTPSDTGTTVRVGGNIGGIRCPEQPIKHGWWPPGGEVYFTIGFSFFFPDAGYR